jgi:hypothetical protein
MALLSPSVQGCWAHPFDVAIVTLDLAGADGAGAGLQGSGTVVLDSRAPVQSAGSDQQEHPDLVVSEIVGAIYLEPSNVRCSVTLVADQSQSKVRNQELRVVCPAGVEARSLRIERDPERLGEAPTELTTVYFISHHGRPYTVTMSRDQRERRVDLEEQGPTFELLRMGVRHIGAAPEEWFSAEDIALPEGIDHILFVLTLVLASSSLLSLIKTVTGFTLGHSISLAVVTLAKTAVPPAIIEPAIAASIVAMALDAMRTRPWPRAWIPATLFGLLHGCGFASALLDRNLEGSRLLFGLLGFNVGVEIGQLIFVILFWGLLVLAAKVTGSRRVVTRTIAGCVCIVAAWWFIERVWGVL